MTMGPETTRTGWRRQAVTFLLFVAIGAGAALGLRSLTAGGDAHASHGAGEMDHSAMPMPEPGTSPEPAPAPAGDGFLIDLGNANCPVMGGPVDGKTFTAWNGLRIGHCCPGCTETLLEDPEKVLDDAGIEWREAAAAAKRLADAPSAEREELLREIPGKWKVVGR